MRTGFLNAIVLTAAAAMALAVLPASAQSVSVTCTTSVTCAAYTNSSSGVGIHGAANTGIGIRGTSVSNTGFYGASSSGSAGAPGIEGESTNSTGNDAAAAFGLAYLSGKPAPAYGAIAYGSAYGVFGETVDAGSSTAKAGYGLFGMDGGSASSKYNYNAGVFGRTVTGTAVVGEANATPQGGVFGTYPVGEYTAAKSHNGNDVSFAYVGETDSYGLDLYEPSTGTTAYILDPGNLIDMYAGGSDGNGSFLVDDAGNATLSGTLKTSKGTYVEAKGTSGAKMIEYSSRLTAPQVEDVGEAQMTNGRAYVSIDARLADTIDRRVAYHVFVTPEGDSKGLYVSQKTPAGFVVREQQGGRSTLAFDYRIVAKPIDEDGKRLAIASPSRRTAGDMNVGRAARSSAPVPLSPEARMKQILGPQGYADAVAAIRKNLK